MPPNRRLARDDRPGALNYGVKTSFFTAPLIAGLAIAPEAVIPAVGLSIAAGETASYATTGKTMTLPQLLITADIASITGTFFSSPNLSSLQIFSAAVKGSLEFYALSGVSGFGVNTFVTLFGGAGAQTNNNTNSQKALTQTNPAALAQSATTSASASSINTIQTNYLKSSADAFLKSGAMGIEFAGGFAALGTGIATVAKSSTPVISDLASRKPYILSALHD